MNAIMCLCHFCEVHGPRILFCTQPLRQEDQNFSDTESQSDVQSPSATGGQSFPPSRTDTCEACHSVHTGFVSYDDEAEVSYVSTQYPHHAQIYAMVRQACVRSLSCEVCPGREGPIFFGDDQRGYVLSYTFYVQDSQARGFRRYYSIIIVMMDKIYLLNSWPFLVPNIQTVVEKLQVKATKLHDAEQAKCPQRAHRLMASSAAPINFRQQRGITKPSRSLMELTEDDNLYIMIHAAFVWILKACGTRLTEILLEGPPTEDSIIDMERQEETEEGFIKLYTRKAGEEDNSSEQLVQDEEADEEFKGPSVKYLRQLYMILGPAQFHKLAYHTIIGNQIIIRGKDRNVVSSLIYALKNLLPRGCCKVIPYSPTYMESWRCNFLGISPECTVPDHVISGEMYMLIDITETYAECLTPVAQGLNDILSVETVVPQNDNLSPVSLTSKSSSHSKTSEVTTSRKTNLYPVLTDTFSHPIEEPLFDCADILNEPTYHDTDKPQTTKLKLDIKSTSLSKMNMGVDLIVKNPINFKGDMAHVEVDGRSANISECGDGLERLTLSGDSTHTETGASSEADTQIKSGAVSPPVDTYADDTVSRDTVVDTGATGFSYHATGSSSRGDDALDISTDTDNSVYLPPVIDYTKYDFNLHSSVVLPDIAPSMLAKIERVLHSPCLTDSVVDKFLLCTREEWMNKVKVLFKFTKAGGSRSDEDTRKLLQVVGAQDDDKQLLKFWMTGLSVQYRTHILSAAAHRP